MSAQFVFEAIGTHWVVDLYQLPSGAVIPHIEAAVMERIERYDRAYSRFRADSQVTQMSQTAGTYLLPADAEPLLTLYHELYQLSHGAFTPLIGNVMEAAGYDATYSLQSQPLTAPPSWDEALAHKKNSLTIKQPVMLDLGAAGKGYLLDLIAELLVSYEVTEFCLDAGGDILRHSAQANPSAIKPLTIGLEHPENTSQVIGTLPLVTGSLCGSAGNRRTWGEYHHIIDPTSLSSPRHLLATWVLAENAMLADGLATCLYLTSAEKLKSKYQFEYAMLLADGTITQSAGFPATFFTS